LEELHEKVESDLTSEQLTNTVSLLTAAMDGLEESGESQEALKSDPTSQQMVGDAQQSEPRDFPDSAGNASGNGPYFATGAVHNGNINQPGPYPMSPPYPPNHHQYDYNDHVDYQYRNNYDFYSGNASIYSGTVFSFMLSLHLAPTLYHSITLSLNQSH
jgi:hypothetical protein